MGYFFTFLALFTPLGLVCSHGPGTINSTHTQSNRTLTINPNLPLRNQTRPVNVGNSTVFNATNPYSRWNKGRCENLGSAERTCLGLGYNFTRFPTKFADSSQKASREFATFIPLIKVQCSEWIKPFLCSVYFPSCQPEGVDSPLPCKELCESAKSGCEHLIKQFGFEWPQRLACHGFPTYNQSHERLRLNPGSAICFDGGVMKANRTATPTTTRTPPPSESTQPAQPPSSLCGSKQAENRLKQVKKRLGFLIHQINLLSNEAASLQDLLAL